MKRLSLISVMIIFIMSLFTTSVSAQTFPDLPNWADKEINYLNQADVVKGLPDGTFGSTKTIARGDAALK